MKSCYCEYFELEIIDTTPVTPVITCVCGQRFSVIAQQTRNKKGEISSLVHCPKCNELWHYGVVMPGYVSAIRPKTNSQLHIPVQQ